MRVLGLVLAIISIAMILFGLLLILTKNNTYYLSEGFESEIYPVDPLTEIQNPVLKLMKKLGSMTVYFANPKVWTDVYRTSQMSAADLARLNIKKERMNKNTL